MGARTLVASEEDVRVLEKSRADHVGKSVILLVESEDRTVGGTCDNQLLDPDLSAQERTGIGGLSNLLLSVSKKEQLESVRNVISLELRRKTHFAELSLVFWYLK